MANFYDLPQAVRENIYRMHLVHGDTIDVTDWRKDVKYTVDYHSRRQPRFMPPICHISKKIEREAAPIYYSENTFEFSNLTQLSFFLAESTLRHQKYIGRIGFKYESSTGDGCATLRKVGRLRGLEVLTIRLNERAMISSMVARHSGSAEWVNDDGPTPQQQMKLLRFPGMSGLLTISGIPEVRLLRLHDTCSDKVDGPIPGGFFETKVVPQLTSTQKGRQVSRAKKGVFRFLDLPAELRNRVYSLLLAVDGPVHPSKRQPTSKPQWFQRDKITPSSALSILQTNKQIKTEADGLFYCANHFIFYNPLQLQSFAINIGALRESMLREITLHYHNTRVGGIQLAEITLAHLRQLKGLQMLTIILASDFSRKLRSGHYDYASINLRAANPGTLPGISHLFNLRDLKHIQLRDPPLAVEVEDLKKDKDYPHFKNHAPEIRRKRAAVKLDLAVQHFNEALSDAQEGKVNRKLLQDNCWQSWDVFPTLEHDGIQDASAPK